MTLGECKTQFSDLLNRRDATASQISTFFNQAFDRIERELRIQDMKETVEIETDDLNYITGLPVPDDFVELDNITINTTYDAWTLDRKSLNEVLTASKIISLPRIFARRGDEWILGPFPEEGTEIRIDYFAALEEVSADADENVITLVCPTLAVYAALSYAGDHFKDKRRDDWENRYKQIRDELHGRHDEDELSGGAAVSAAYVWPSDDYSA
jgi:hypothetical protein